MLSAVLPAGDGSLLVRVYETAGKRDSVRLTFADEVADARQVNLLEEEREGAVSVAGRQVEFEVEPHALAEVKIILK